MQICTAFCYHAKMQYVACISTVHCDVIVCTEEVIVNQVNHIAYAAAISKMV